jgi:predicted HTH domain antitoxin
MASVKVEIPDDLLPRLSSENGAPEEMLRRIAAYFMCSRGELSTSQAARLAGMSYGEFLEAAAGARVMLFPVDLEELKEEATCGFTLGRQRFANHPASQGGVN